VRGRQEETIATNSRLRIVLDGYMVVRTLAAGLLAAALAPGDHASAQQFTVLYSFCSQQNCADGSRPVAGLTIDIHGALYGTTNQGGATNNGAAFKLAPPATPNGQWPESVLYSFCSAAQCIDGAEPGFARLLFDKHGGLFGTAPGGGGHNDGAVFKLTPPSAPSGIWTETVLYSFCSLTNCTDGADPEGA